MLRSRVSLARKAPSSALRAPSPARGRRDKSPPHPPFGHLLPQAGEGFRTGLLLHAGEGNGAGAEFFRAPLPPAGEGVGVRAALVAATREKGPLIRPFGPPSPTRGEGNGAG